MAHTERACRPGAHCRQALSSLLRCAHGTYRAGVVPSSVRPLPKLFAGGAFLLLNDYIAPLIRIIVSTI